MRPRAHALMRSMTRRHATDNPAGLPGHWLCMRPRFMTA
ncbi:hypothetical protein D187_004927 [Cystobacter fuscus DSM 2262]|uniref:Uncharacterized protein n=1 Tax=Cystobacter fuscus (strain ATCC 25194 / DSM 2262 / NBRC 100088 / M29) TaxID=1242864 RepID=S9R4H5_CYSF2|nr:hypothetical protein D187_004927 [Cystobacter fuscus DSM 2262]